MQYAFQNNISGPYNDMDDSNVARLATEGDIDALNYLLIKYKNLARNKARSYFIIGADREDIIQEGMIGLFKAIRDYRPDKLSSFYTFADLCITRQIITAIKTATRQKHIPLNSYVSLYKPIEEESARTLLDVLTKPKDLNPENIFIDEENINEIEHKINEILSHMELKVLTLFLQEKSYQQIAETLDCSSKSVDNALQRIKKKLDGYLSSRD